MSRPVGYKELLRESFYNHIVALRIKIKSGCKIFLVIPVTNTHHQKIKSEIKKTAWSDDVAVLVLTDNH